MSLGVFAGGFVPVFEELAKDDGLIGMYETLKNPAMISIIGPTPIKSASEYSLPTRRGQGYGSRVFTSERRKGKC